MEARALHTFINTLKETYGEQITIDSTNPTATYLTIDASFLKSIVESIAGQLRGRFVTCAAIDRRKTKGVFTIVYLFALDKEKAFVGIKINKDPSTAPLDSITPIIPGANWSERELKEMSGIDLQGHPDLRRLILADDWPAGEYPLREDFAFDYKPSSASGVAPGLKTLPASTTLLPLGSFYAQKETTTCLNLFIYGEKVVDVDYRGFYNHRGLEKMADSVLSYNQIPMVAERICACCGFSHSTCYCQAIEVAAHMTVPPRAQFIRTLLLEVERLYSHSLWLASLCNLEGLKDLFIKCCTLQQSILQLSQLLTGNRIIFDMNVIGGVRKDIAKEQFPHLSKLISQIEKHLKVILADLAAEVSFFSRLKGISTLPHNDTINFCAVGHAARASGVPIDVRVDHPYAAYDSISVEKICREEGDNFARISIRLDEMNQSLALIREAIEKMPGGEIRCSAGEIPPLSDSISAVESPRGETVHYILTGNNNRPLRWKIRSATFTHLQIIPVMLRGTNIADARISISSIDPCFSCVEH